MVGVMLLGGFEGYVVPHNKMRLIYFYSAGCKAVWKPFPANFISNNKINANNFYCM